MYNDGTPSRELEEEEPRARIPVVAVRNNLNSLSSLVHICIVALTSKEQLGQQYNQLRVAEVLCDFVEPGIKHAEEDLRYL